MFRSLFHLLLVQIEMYRSELAKVRVELEPWEKQLIEHKGKLEVARTESRLLTEKVKLLLMHFLDYTVMI